MQSYKFDEHGTFVLCDDANKVLARLDPSEKIAIFHDDGVLLKHGCAPSVRANADLVRSKMAAIDPELVSGYEVIEYPIEIFGDPDMLEELNLTLACSGRVQVMREALVAKMSAVAAPDMG